MSDYREALAARAGGTAIALRVVPRARRPGIDGLHAGAVRLRVTAPPAGGRANEEVLVLLAGALGLRARDLELVAGARSRDKTVLVPGLEPDEVARRLGPPP